jgi:GxxExxY protein
MMEMRPLPPELNVLSGEVVDAALKVHKTLGPGLLESVYERCLCRELLCRGVPFRSQLDLPIEYDGMVIDSGLRIDLMVDGRLIVELKAVETLHPLHSAQLLTYLKLTGLRLGLIINFNVPLLRDGLRRIAL